MLNAIIFACGAALMGLEIVAARVLAPVLGNSIYVWGSVISTVMAALALGYWIGGQAADRYGPSRVLPMVIAGAATLTVSAPIAASAVLPWVGDLGPRVGSLAASALIFFAPALLLATVSPLGVRIAASKGMSHVGRSAGGLYAVSTGGSIVGTLATSFWLIPLLSIEPLIVWTGFLLLLASLAALALPSTEEDPAVERAGGGVNGRSPRRRTSTATLVLAGIAGAIGVFVLIWVAPPSDTNRFGETILLSEDTQYHRVSVTEDEEARHLRFNSSHQSAISLEDPYVSLIRYPDYLHLALALNPDAERVLVLGMGGGAVSKRMWRDYPEVALDSVEIDPVVARVAREYFGMPEDERSQIIVEDARRYVQSAETEYDIIIVDAYHDDALPFHLTTQEFFAEIDEILAPGGTVAYNVISSVEGGGSDLFRSIYRTADTIWQDLWVFPIGLSSGGTPETRRNVILLATDKDISREELVESIDSRIDGRVSVAGFAEFDDDLYTEIVPVADVPLLTDSHAPTDSLIQVQ